MAITITEPSATLPNGTISRFVPVHNPILFTITSGSTSIKIDIHRTDASPSIINTNDLIFLAGTDFTFVFDASPYVKSILNNDLDITYTADATKEDTEGVLPFYIVVTEYPEASPIVSETSNTFYGVNSVLQIQNRYGNNQGNYLVDDNADVANVVDFLIGSDRLRYWIGYPFSLPYLNNDVTSSAINIDGELVFTTSIADSVNHYILSLQTEGARNIYLQSLLAFSSVWITTNAGSDSDQIVLPLIASGSYNFVVDWGDGNQDTITTYNQAEVTHTYTTSGTKGLTIVGTIQGWQFNNTGDKEKILSISNWGSLGMSAAGFYGCSNLSLVGATGVPTFVNLGNQSNFRDCTNLTTIGNVENWDVSNITSFQSFFQGATSFNDDLSGWDVSSATTFASMFNGASAFNNGVAGSGTGTMSWTGGNCSNVTDFSLMFSSSSSFNQNVNAWDVGSGATFNKMFNVCTNFNQPLNSWVFKTTGTISMDGMFQFTTLFDQDLSAWNVSAVTDMGNMFNTAGDFNNGGVALTWTTGTGTANVTDFANMFDSTPLFNQDLSSWDVSSATTLASMFSGASAFDQNLSSWDILAMTTAANMFDSSGLSQGNYDNLLIGWEGTLQATYSGGVGYPNSPALGATGVNFTTATSGTERTSLVNNFNFTITDAGGNP